MANDMLYLSLLDGTYVGKVTIADGCFSVKWRTDAGVVYDALSRIIQSANTNGLDVWKSHTTGANVIEMKQSVGARDKAGLAALRDKINSADWVSPRCFASFRNPLASMQTRNGSAGAVHLAYAQKRVVDVAFSDEIYDICIPTLRLPGDTRYASIAGENFSGLAIRYGMERKETPYKIENEVTGACFAEVG